MKPRHRARRARARRWTPPPPERVETRDVLAGAYKGKRADLKNLLRHAVDTATEISLCGRIGAESICDQALGGPELVTCAACQRRDPRRPG